RHRRPGGCVLAGHSAGSLSCTTAPWIGELIPRGRSRRGIDWRGNTPHPCNLRELPPEPHKLPHTPWSRAASCGPHPFALQARSTPVTETREDVTWLTQEAHDRLKAELDHLAGPARVEIAKKINAARDEGDLRENGGYHAAKEEQGKQEARIRQ